MSRFKSIPLWTAILALIYLIAKNWFNFEIVGWEDITKEIIAILVIVFGIGNNPTDKENY